MPTDGLARYDKLSGPEIVVELQSLDRNRFPENYETLLREISARGPVSAPLLVEHEVERYDALPQQERRRFLIGCLKRIGILLIQYQIFGGIAATFVSALLAIAAKEALGADYESVEGGLTLGILFLLSIASYWAFLRWMLLDRVANMEVAIIRPKILMNSEESGGATVVSPNQSLARSRDG
jgi:hypothetical protein